MKLDDLEATFWEEVAKLQKDGPTQNELDAARTSNLTGTISGLQRLGGFGGVADMLNEYNQYTGDPGYLSKDLARYQAATIGSVKDAAAKYLDKAHAVVVSCVPGKKVVDDVPRSPADTDKDAQLTPPYKPEFETAQEWRKAVPKPGAALTFHLPVPATFTLKNGMPVYLVHDASLPVVSATVVTRAGGEATPADKPGLADFTAGMLSEGTTTRSATQIAEDAERIGTRLSVFANMDGTNAGVTVLTNHADEALGLLSDVLQHPAFKEDELERVRKRRMLAIQQEGDSAAAIASRVGPRLIYGDTPYGFTMSGTVDSLKAVTREEMQAFWSSHYGPGDSALILAGDVTEATAKALAEKHFGSWSGSAKGEVKLPATPADPTLKVVIVDKPGSPQTALLAYGLGVPVTVSDLPAVRVMNYTLGGSFGSRINMNLREVHGYTYGANSRYSLYREGGPFVAGGLVKTDVTAPAAKELLAELKRIQTELPTAEELKMAKDASIQSLPGQFETTNATAAAMSSIFLYKRPLNYYATLPDAFRAVTAEDVAKAAKADVHPDHLVIVAVGDKSKIEAGLKEVNLAPIEYVDVSGGSVK